MVLARLNADGILMGHTGTPLFRKSAANDAGGLRVPSAVSGDSDAATRVWVVAIEPRQPAGPLGGSPTPDGRALLRPTSPRSEQWS